MQTYSLKISSRDNTGRGVARRLRAEGRIPASLYGQGNARSISVSAVDFRNLNREMHGGAAIVELEDEKGGTALSLVQDIQRDAFKNVINHIDFQEIERGHSFVTHVPVELIAESDCIGVKNEGGVIDHKLYEIEIRCRPSNLPENVEVNVSQLRVGDAILIQDLPDVEGVEYLGEPAQVIVSCQPPTVEAEPVEGATEIAADEVPASKVSDDDSAEDGKESDSKEDKS
ncbi:MAG: 50S ribosomal protein L25 [Opitutales bacterium]